MIGIHAKYTVVLAELLKDPHTKSAIDAALNTYPMYEPTSKNEFIPRIVPTRAELNEKILNHYKYREIGFESVGRFIDELKIAMCEIMPYYNQVLFTQDQDYNIIFNVDYQKTIDTARTGESTSSANGSTSDTSATTSSGESNNKTVKSSTPQDTLYITGKDISKVNYADEVEWNKDESQSEATSTNSGKTSSEVAGQTSDSEKTVETTKGNFGVMATQDLITKYRDLILNTEQLIINDDRIKELFMLVY